MTHTSECKPFKGWHVVPQTPFLQQGKMTSRKGSLLSLWSCYTHVQWGCLPVFGSRDGEPELVLIMWRWLVTVKLLQKNRLGVKEFVRVESWQKPNGHLLQRPYVLLCQSAATDLRWRLNYRTFGLLCFVYGCVWCVHVHVYLHVWGSIHVCAGDSGIFLHGSWLYTLKQDP